MDKQEPVGWYDSISGLMDFTFYRPVRKPSSPSAEWVPVYAAPPKREWVGYTNEDRERIVPMLVQSLINHDEKTMAGLLNAILIDIEQQLKEKNT